jgi:hypothetical protein
MAPAFVFSISRALTREIEKFNGFRVILHFISRAK